MNDQGSQSKCECDSAILGGGDVEFAHPGGAITIRYQ